MVSGHDDGDRNRPAARLVVLSDDPAAEGIFLTRFEAVHVHLRAVSEACLVAPSILQSGVTFSHPDLPGEASPPAGATTSHRSPSLQIDHFQVWGRDFVGRNAQGGSPRLSIY